MISPNFLAARLGLGKESAKLLRAAMNRHKSYGSLHRAYAALDLANFQLRGRGVNCIRGRSQWDPYWRDVEAVYVNRGDATTLVYDCRRKIFQVTTCGRWVATAERRGVRFKTVPTP